ncbi:MAG: hypothetical protein M1825_000586 [Sarcosagium campestre]|nr:MAG: hypothetical protein M1825_000586 [Sarcosagium campestre]
MDNPGGSLNFGGSPAPVQDTFPSNDAGAHDSILDPIAGAPQEAQTTTQTSTTDNAATQQQGTDVAMSDNADGAGNLSLDPQPLETSTSTPAVISDNPLDAPEGPPPAGQEDEEREDEEMGDAAAQPKKENDGSPEKDANGATSPQPAEEEVVEQPVQTKASIESAARAHLTSQTYAIILPSYSTWFDMHSIHALEKKALPEFFNNRNRSKTPVVYKDYRDFMINTYRLNPAEYLTATACRRNLTGDVCALTRLHSFLEQWGLINYQVDAEVRPSNIGPPFTGHFQITADTPRGLQPFQPAPSPVVLPGKPYTPTEKAATAATPPKSDLNLQVRRDIYDQSSRLISTTDARKDESQSNGDGAATNGVTSEDSAKSVVNDIENHAKETKKQLNCHTCGVDCTRIRYHHAGKSPQLGGGAVANGKTNFDICPNCFIEARFPSSLNATEFFRMEDPSYTTIPDRDAPWSDSETLLLLEAIERFDDNWNAIADHVGTRSREQCVLKFLQVPIEDQYLGDEQEGGHSKYPYEFLTGGRAPFSQADNPVLSVVSFLASLGDQRVAAAAAGRAVEEMRQGLRDRLEIGLGGGKDDAKTSNIAAQDKSKGKGKDAVAAAAAAASSTNTKTEDRMDVDKPASSSSDARLSSVATTSTTQKEGETAATAEESSTAATISAATALSTIPLAASAARAAALVSHEEREMQRSIASAVNATLAKHQLKHQYFLETEAVLRAERRELDRARNQLFLDRLDFKRRVKEVEEALRLASLRGGPEAAALAAEAANSVSKEGRLGLADPHPQDIHMLSSEAPAQSVRTLEV